MNHGGRRPGTCTIVAKWSIEEERLGIWIKQVERAVLGLVDGIAETDLDDKTHSVKEQGF